MTATVVGCDILDSMRHWLVGCLWLLVLIGCNQDAPPLSRAAVDAMLRTEPNIIGLLSHFRESTHESCVFDLVNIAQEREFRRPSNLKGHWAEAEVSLRCPDALSPWNHRAFAITFQYLSDSWHVQQITPEVSAS